MVKKGFGRTENFSLHLSTSFLSKSLFTLPGDNNVEKVLDPFKLSWSGAQTKSKLFVLILKVAPISVFSFLVKVLVPGRYEK